MSQEGEKARLRSQSVQARSTTLRSFSIGSNHKGITLYGSNGLLLSIIHAWIMKNYHIADRNEPSMFVYNFIMQKDGRYKEFGVAA